MWSRYKVDTDKEDPAIVNRLPSCCTENSEEDEAERRTMNAEMEAVMITVESLIEQYLKEPLQEYKPLSYCKLYEKNAGNCKVKYKTFF